MAASFKHFIPTYFACLLYSICITTSAIHIRETSDLVLRNDIRSIINDSEQLSNYNDSDSVTEHLLNLSSDYLENDYKSQNNDKINYSSETETNEIAKSEENSFSTTLETIITGDSSNIATSSESLEMDTYQSTQMRNLEQEEELLNKSINNYVVTKNTVLQHISAAIKKKLTTSSDFYDQNSTSSAIFDDESNSDIYPTDRPSTTVVTENQLTKALHSSFKRSFENMRQRLRLNSSRASSAVGRIALPHSDWPEVENKETSSTTDFKETFTESNMLLSTLSSHATDIYSSSPSLVSRSVTSSYVEEFPSASSEVTEEEIKEYVNELRSGRAAVYFNNEVDNSVDQCETSAGTRGTCTPLMKCEEVLKNLKTNKQPNICGWIKDMPVVCCPRTIGGRNLNIETCGVRPMLNGLSRSRSEAPNKAARMPMLFTQEPFVFENKSRLIIGGKESVLGAWPWMAGIYTMNFNIENFFCGAAILNELYLVTAAHCFGTRGRGARIQASRYAIRVGSTKVRDGTRYLVDEITVHPDYIPREYYNDIAVIRLKEPLEFSNTVQPICMPVSPDFRRRLAGRNVTVVGWGDQDFGGKRGEILREVTIPIIDISACDQAYLDKRGTSIPRGITRQFLCAGAQEGGKDACQRDSGGPLMMNERNVWFLVGVVSFGFRCGEPGIPGVYTKITHYMDWLQNVTSLNQP